MIENYNRMANCYYVIRTKTGSGGIKEITSLPDQEYDVDIGCRITISRRYYVTHHPYENIHLVKHKKDIIINFAPRIRKMFVGTLKISVQLNSEPVSLESMIQILVKGRGKLF